MDSYLTYHEFISYSQCFKSVHTLFRNHLFIHTLLIIPSNLHSLLTIGIHTLFTIQISYLIEQPHFYWLQISSRRMSNEAMKNRHFCFLVTLKSITNCRYLILAPFGPFLSILQYHMNTHLYFVYLNTAYCTYF